MTAIRRGCLAAAAAFTILISAPGHAQETLSLGEALRMSTDRQPALAAYTRTAQAAQSAAIAARQLPDLTLRGGLRGFPVTGDDAFEIDAVDMTMLFIGVGREQVRRSRREAAAIRILAEGQVSLAEQDVLARRIQRDVMLGWTAVVEARQKQELLDILVSKLEARQNLIQAQIPTGVATPADALAIEAEISAVRAELLAAQDAEAAGRAMLARWIGEASERPITSKELPICRPANKQEALALLADHPLIEVARRQTRAAERAIDVARADREPNWGWSALYGKRFGGRSDVVSLEVSIDLPLNRARLQNQRIAEAASLAAAARDRVEDARREVISEFEQAWAQWGAANARLKTARGETLPALDATETALEARVAGGQPALTDVQAVSERFTRTALDAIGYRADLARSTADLLFYLEECTT